MHGPLTKTDLVPAGPLSRLGGRVKLFTDIDSTNAYLIANANSLGDGTVALAEYQRVGRGRFGRPWRAPRGSSILMSILLIEPDDSPLITHAAQLTALAAAEALEFEVECRPALRWPNDLIVSGKKLGGVLAETTPLPRGNGGRRALVVGIGLNCFQQAGHFGAELGGIATSLEIELPQPVDRAGLARQLLARFDACFAVERRSADDWQWLYRAWTARCEDLGARVTLETDSSRHTGTVLEIADNGDLIVQLDNGGRRRFESATTTRIR